MSEEPEVKVTPADEEASPDFPKVTLLIGDAAAELFEVLDNPPPPTETMRRAFARYAEKFKNNN